MVQPNQQTDYCREYDSPYLHCPLLLALAELQEAESPCDFLEHGPRFATCMLAQLLFKAPKISKEAIPSMIEALHGNNTLELKFLANVPLFYIGDFRDSVDLGKVEHDWQASKKPGSDPADTERLLRTYLDRRMDVS